MLQLDRRNLLKHVSRHSSAPEQRPAFEVTDAATVELLSLLPPSFHRKSASLPVHRFAPPSPNVNRLPRRSVAPERRGPFSTTRRERGRLVGDVR
jgi:hypothetical protein